MMEKLFVLLVEDDRHIALALQIRLRAAGYVVTLASSVAEAQSSVEKHVPDVALLDVNLPDGDGVELMQHFAASRLSNSIMTIIMTASRKQGLREQALVKGAAAFLEKPFSSAVLLEAVASRANQTKAG